MGETLYQASPVLPLVKVKQILQLNQTINPTFMFSRRANMLHAVSQSHTHTLAYQALGSGQKDFLWHFSDRLFELLKTFGDSRSISAVKMSGDFFDLFSHVGNLFPPGSKTRNTRNSRWLNWAN